MNALSPDTSLDRQNVGTAELAAKSRKEAQGLKALARAPLSPEKWPHGLFRFFFLRLLRLFAAKLRFASFVLAVFLAASGGGCSRETTPAQRLQTADKHFQAAEYEKAEIEYLNVLKAQPRHTTATARLGIISQIQGQWTKALAWLPQARAADTNDTDVPRSLALTYVAVHRYEQAREEAAFVLDRLPADPEALFALVDAAREPKEMEAARARVQKAQQQAGAGAVFDVALGELSLRQRDFKSAEAHFRQALERDGKSSAALAGLAGLQLVLTNRSEAGRLLKAAAELAPPRSFVRLKWADFLAESGQLDDAKRFLEATAKEAAGFLPALNRLARLALEQRQYDECAGFVRRILSAEPLSFEGRLTGARLKLAQNEPERAVEDLERLTSAYPRVPVVRRQLATAYLLNGNMTRAVSSLEQAVKMDPGYGEAVLLLAELNLRRGDAASAVQALTEFLKRRPQSLPARYALAEAYRTQGKLDEAAGVYRQLTQLTSADPQASYLLGETLRQQKKTGDARRALEQALGLDAGFLRALVQLVELDLEAKDADAALQRVQKHLASQPKQAEAHFLLAQVYLAKGDNARAEEVLLKAIELNPDFSQGYVAVARLMVASGRQAQARERLEAALTRNPKDVAALMLLGMLHDQEDNHIAAGETYDRLLKVNPRFAPALNNAAYLFAVRLGQIPKGLELARRARELAPFDPFTADTLGWILLQRGDHPAALALLQESAEKLSGEPEVLFHLGTAHYLMGEEIPARTFLERALAVKGRDFASRAAAEQRLTLLDLDPSKADTRALALLNARLAERADDPIAVSRIAALLVRRGEADKAIKICERALQTNPSAAALVVRLAELYSDHKRDAGRALDYARQARKLAPDDAGVAFTLGQIAFKNRDHKWAYSLLQDAARRLSHQQEALSAAGLAAYSLGRISEAETLLQRALQQPGDPPPTNAARHVLAMISLARDPAKLPAALPQLTETLQRHPDDVPALMAAGLAHEQRGNLADAQKHYERALAVYPLFTPAMKSLARISVERNDDLQRAYELATKAREAFPDDADLARTLGILAYRRSDFAYAARVLKEVVRQRTNDATAFFHLGMAQYRLKERVGSRQALARALELDAHAAFAPDARRALAERN
jgi:tetratricopeptide (TPR) repeat protein